MLIKMNSILTGVTNQREIAVTPEQLAEWKEGDLPIQDVLGHLSDDDREFLISGSTPEEWEEFGRSEKMCDGCSAPLDEEGNCIDECEEA